MMSSHEISTAVHYGVKIIILLINNGSYGTIRMHQERDYPGRKIATDLKIIERNMSDKLTQLHELIKLKAKQINQSNPKFILKKGYAIVRDNKYRIIKNSVLAKNDDH